MNNIAIDVHRSNTIQSEYDNKHHIKVALPADAYDDDSSNNNKKSRKALFKKVQSSSPKLDKYTTPNMTPKALANVYQNLSLEQQKNFLDEIANQNGAMTAVYNALPDRAKGQFEVTVSQVLAKKFLEMFENLPAQDKNQAADQVNNIMGSFINGMPSAQRNEFLSKFAALLNKQLGNGSLSASDKVAIKAFIEKINKYVNKSGGNNAPQGGSDDKFDDSGITNIMMILVKVFCHSMNVESMDMLQQIQDMSFTNKFLEYAKQQLEKNIGDLTKATEDPKKWWQHWGLWIAIGVVVLVALVVVAAVFTGQIEVLAPAADVMTDLTGEGAVDGLGDGIGDGIAEDLSADEEVGLPGADDPIEEGYQPLVNEDVGLPQVEEESDEVEVQTTRNIGKEEEGVQNAEDNAQEAINTQAKETTPKEPLKPTRWDRLRLRKARAAWNFTKLLGKVLGFGTVGVIGSNLAGSQFAPNFFLGMPKQANSTELEKYSQIAQLEGSIVDQMNNKLQLSSRNESNDSDKVSQFANFVNQAINMFGQSFVTK